MMKILKIYDLSPDGVTIEVNWKDMTIGSSIFVPCINTGEAVKQVTKIFSDRSWELEHRLRIEGGNLGVRCWRTV
jgi:hypothetical protein